MNDVDRLTEKLKRIEALFSRPGSEGERQAAEQARQQVLKQLKEFERRDPPIEYRFSMTDSWSQRLFIALLRRYDLTPYRYRGQRRTTVMVRVPRRFVDETLWPEFQALSKTLSGFFDILTKEVIADVLQGDGSDAEEREPIGAIEQ